MLLLLLLLQVDSVVTVGSKLAAGAAEAMQSDASATSSTWKTLGSSLLAMKSLAPFIRQSWSSSSLGSATAVAASTAAAAATAACTTPTALRSLCVTMSLLSLSSLSSSFSSMTKLCSSFSSLTLSASM